MECERVSSALRIPPAGAPQEWRTHFEQTIQHKQVIDRYLPETKKALTKIAHEIRDTHDRISEREAWIQQQFEPLIQQHQQVAKEYKEAQSRYNKLTQDVMAVQLTNKKLTDTVDSLRTQMEERSSRVTDSSPLRKIKECLKQLETEIRQMELRIGLIVHTLLQAEMRESRLAMTERNSSNPKGTTFPQEDNKEENF
eukprot:GHVQ01032240.1.p1 GENE.GHVQ01032240.1~~GHVQ01032240.1.p1  ORF type:complete len:197 (+),score=32.57 GHVQ01032240.1:1113-1703(+)